MSSFVQEKRADGIDVLVLKNEDIEVWFSTMGASILKLLVKDRNGNFQDVAMGYADLEDYPKYRAYLGAAVGRTANRIKNGRFVLNGQTYQLPINNGPNCNHGGTDGFSFRIFDYRLQENAIVFTLFSPDGEEGYPGNLQTTITCTVAGSSLEITYEACSDADTLVNLTNHTYFNLSGHPDWIGKHLLSIDADCFGEIDKDGLVTGRKIQVENTPFDFRQEKPLETLLESENSQVELGYGLDHSFVLNTEEDCVHLYSPESGIELTLSTSMPQVQLYTANYFEDWKGKNDTLLSRQCSVALETQYNPDDINLHPDTTPTLLKKGERFSEQTSFRFSVRK